MNRDLTYEFKQVQFLVNAGNPGSQMKGDVDITVNGCKASYQFVGVAPAHSCYYSDPANLPVRDSEGNQHGGKELEDYPTITADANGVETWVPDPSKCDPNPRPDLGRSTGSGLNPDLDVACNEYSGYCVLAGDAIDFQRISH